MIRKLMVVVAVLGIAGTGALAQGVTFSGSATWVSNTLAQKKMKQVI